MTFNLLTVYVNNMAESLHFYQDLIGLELRNINSTGDGLELAFLGKAGQPNIELIYNPKQTSNTYSGFTIGFKVDSLQEASERLTAQGYPIVRGPISPNPSVVFSYLYDPNGIEIQLAESR